MSMGTEGMSFSLQSRDLIADSIETVVSAQWYDALIAIPGKASLNLQQSERECYSGCDKNMPGTMMAIGRLNRPALMLYGGTISAGRSCIKNKPIDIEAAFQTYGAFSAGLMTEEERFDVVRHACPGAGDHCVTGGWQCRVCDDQGLVEECIQQTPCPLQSRRWA